MPVVKRRGEVCCVAESLVLIYSGRMIFQEIWASFTHGDNE